MRRYVTNVVKIGQKPQTVRVTVRSPLVNRPPPAPFMNDSPSQRPTPVPFSPDRLSAGLSGVFDRHRAKNVTFRALARCDAFPLYEATRNEEFNRFLLWSAPSMEDEILPQVDKLLREVTLRRAVVVSLCDKQTGLWRGAASVRPLRDGVEMGLWLHPNAWNTGIVLTAGRMVIEVLRATWPTVPIYNRVLPDNKKMRRICLSYGFEKVDAVTAVHENGHELEFDLFQLNPDKWKVFDEVTPY